MSVARVAGHEPCCFQHALYCRFFIYQWVTCDGAHTAHIQMRNGVLRCTMLVDNVVTRCMYTYPCFLAPLTVTGWFPVCVCVALLRP